MKICVEFEYAAAGNVTLVNGKLTFPSLSTGPGIYRFRLEGAGVESISTYIGETDNLRRRSNQYRNPGPSQKTNVRLNTRLIKHLEEGGTVDLSTVVSSTLVIGNREGSLDFTHKEHRRLLENAALITNPKAELIENF